MAKRESNRILIQELEAHAEQQGLLKEVVNVSKKLRNVKVYRGKYLVLDPESQKTIKNHPPNSDTTKKNRS